jgi:hypothetical protein
MDTSDKNNHLDIFISKLEEREAIVFVDRNNNSKTTKTCEYFISCGQREGQKCGKPVTQNIYFFL